MIAKREGVGEERTRSLGLADVNYYILAFPGGSVVKICLSMQGTLEMSFRSLGQEDPLEEEMATHSSILARKIPRTVEPGGL